MLSLDDLKAKAEKLAAQSSSAPSSLAFLSSTGSSHLSNPNESVSQDDSQVDNELAAVKARCSVLWNQFVQQQANSQGTPVTANLHPTVQRLGVLEAIEKKHEKELEMLKEKELRNDSVIPQMDPKVVDLMVEKQIRIRTQELQEAIRYLRLEVALAREELIREEEIQKEQEIVRQQFRAKYQSLEGDLVQSGLSVSSAERELADKTREVAGGNVKLMTRLLAFLEKYYPPVDPAKAQKKKKKARGRKGKDKEIVNEDVEEDQGSDTEMEGNQTSSLKDILEDLMNLTVTKTGDPYLVLGPQHWRPYIELLIRAGIAVKHPKDGTRLKLVEFHL